jgi:enoyl-CoA hydratase
LLLTTDIRILSERARIGLPEIKIGLFPGAGGTQRLLRQVPLCRAKEMMMLGEPITAQEAVTYGLANRVVPHEQLMPEALATAERLGRMSPLVLKLLKRSMLQGADMPLGSALAFEHAMIGLVFDTADSKEGCGAFLEKRAPDFRGR